MTRSFHGPLAAQFEEFASLMRSTGAAHVTLLANAHRLDDFLTAGFPCATTLTKDIVSSWFASFAHLRPSSQRRYRSATFQVCHYLRRRDSDTADRSDFESPRRPRDFKPYIFSRAEVYSLLEAARALRPSAVDPMRPKSMELVLLLLYTAGLRIGEVVRLNVGDYDAALGAITIRETKFEKTRLVPLSRTTRQAVDAYLERRYTLGIPCELANPLRATPGGRPRSLGSVQAAVTRLMKSIGLKSATGRGPRVHDLRHTFAVHRVEQWYRDGHDVQSLLPHLATYMGHRGLESTQYYLWLTPDVLHAAADRFRLLAQQTANAGGEP